MGLQTSSTPVNLHSPTAIGDVAPNTVAATALATGAIRPASGNLILTASNGVDKINVNQSGFDVNFGGGIVLSNGAASFCNIYSGGNSLDFAFNSGVFIFFANGVMRMANCPTSAAGRASGDVYSNAGILTIVP